jgi:hypothetical protein
MFNHIIPGGDAYGPVLGGNSDMITPGTERWEVMLGPQNMDYMVLHDSSALRAI